MGADTKIEWASHTWNPWRGCVKVSPGCAHCYAERQSHRNPAVLGEWGPGSARAIGAEDCWKQPFRWERSALAAGERRRVFSLSLGDWLEDRPDLDAPRFRMLDTIRRTPGLDYLLLTKRPENIGRMLPADWGRGYPNVWLMVSVENADYLHRIDKLKAIPARVLGLSIEPLLGPIPTLGEHLDGIDWVITGGESGPDARPMHPQWVRSIRDQCAAAGVPFHFKQWGEWIPFGQLPAGWSRSTEAIHGWGSDGVSYRVGKRAAGRLLDGVEWSEFPTPVESEATR